jgi:hypothetical protein
MVVEFDTDPPRTVGEARPLGETTRVDNPALASTVPILDIADNGTLVFAPGSASLWDAEAVWVDRLGNPVGEAGAIAVPAISFLQLSPDERRLAISYKSGRQAVVDIIDLDRGIATPAFRADSIVSVQPIWMTDGEHLTVAICGTETGTLLQIRSDGDGEAQELFTVPTLFGAVPWSATSDGDQIAYTIFEQEKGGNNGRFHGGDGASGREYLASDAYEMQIKLSPDGRWVAYASDETGQFEIYIREYPGGGGKHRVSDSGGIAPTWSGNGRELFFQSEDGRRVLTASVDTVGGLTVGTPQLLFEGPFRRSFDVGQSYDVTADAQRFLMMRVDPQLETARELIVVQNWSLSTSGF